MENVFHPVSGSPLETLMSIREVAARAGVSLGTVSKAFDENAKVSVHTRERVRRVATELGYHPSAVARALVRKRTDTVGVILPPDLVSPVRSAFFATIFDALVIAAAPRGKDIAICTGHRWTTAAASLPRFRDGRCDGFLVFCQPGQSDLLAALLDARIPFVLVNDRGDDPRLHFVDIDSAASARAMMAHLLSLGHRRIALLGGSPHVSSLDLRIESYCDALHTAGIAYDPALVPPGSFNATSVQKRVENLLDLPPSRRPTALFCLTDTLALTALRVLRQRGVRVPEDMSVAGHDDLPGSADEHPSLTTMRQPFDRIAERALDLLAWQEEGVSERGRQVLIPAELMVRGSTAPAATVVLDKGV